MMTNPVNLLHPPEFLFEPFSHSTRILPNHIHLVGFEFDGTACFRKGARLAPDQIRKQSPGIETYSPYLDRDLEDCAVIDLGNLPLEHTNDMKAWYKACESFQTLCAPFDLSSQHIRFLTLGGEHSISYAPLQLYLQHYPDLLILHLDAHADLRDGYEGYHFSHAAIIRRVTELFGSGHQLVQYGIRSGTREEYQWMRKHQTLFVRCQELLHFLDQLPAQRPIYVTLDLDFFDPAYLPGTGTPEPGGEDFHAFVQICKVLADKNLVGADVVELAPDIDPTENSSVFASKVVRELILLL